MILQVSVFRLVRNILVTVLLCALHVTAFSQIFLNNRFSNLSFVSPVGVFHPNDTTERLCVVEQGGVIRIFPDDSSVTSAKVFLDISDSIVSGGEMGLLGLAFHPRYATNGYIYVDYDKDNPLRTVISRFRVSASNPDSIDRSSEVIILQEPQPFTNHKGGQLAFGPDGYLYIAFGDGGSEGDPNGNGQNRSTLLGKILRINVDSTVGVQQYAIPIDNPFYGDTTKKQEIFVYGLRNPWRFSFDGPTLWCGDVGQDLWEEIDTIMSGRNYGWNIMEGFHCYNPSTGCDTTGLTVPIWEYGHDAGRCAIMGGFVYRGTAIPSLSGKYIYGDYCTGEVWTLTTAPSSTPVNTFLLASGINISSFGVDRHNELYVCDVSGGKIYKFWTSPPGPTALIAPYDGAINQPRLLTCSWNSADGAFTYQLQVAYDSMFTSLAVNDSTIQDTTKQIGPLADSTLFFWRVRSLNGVGAGAYTPFRRFTTAGSSARYPVSKYWNLLSLPVGIAGALKSVLYPSATSAAFAYDPSSGYLVHDTLVPGIGFWLEFADNEMIELSGTAILTDTVAVADGWNLVGSVSQPVAVSQIASIPGGLVTSQFFGYQGGYIQSDTIVPGQGYWVKTNGGGTLILSIGPVSQRIRIIKIDEQPPAPPGMKNSGSGLLLPRRYALEQNYPNPFNPSTVIRYSLPVSGYVTLKIYNILGSEVATVVNGIQEAGYKSVAWDAYSGGGVSSGLYFYRLTAGSYSAVGKMMLVK